MELDVIDKISSRGARFIRATEIMPFTVEIKKQLKEIYENMLDQITILQEKHSPLDERIEIIKRLFTTFMEYPEFLTSYPKFRLVSERKIKEISDELTLLNKPPLEILHDYKFYLNMLKARSDYVEYNVEPVIIMTLPVVEPKKHSYNLRSRKTKN